MRHGPVVALVLACASQAHAIDWNGQWLGNLDSGTRISVTIRNGEVKEYRFNGRSAPFVYASVRENEVSFSPGASTLVTLTATGPGQAKYFYANPIRGSASGQLTKAASHAAAERATPNVRIDGKWLGVWGKATAIKLDVQPTSITYGFRGEGYPVSEISVSGSKLAFRVGEAAHLSMSLRPDGKADYAFSYQGKTTRGLIWRGTSQN